MAESSTPDTDGSPGGLQADPAYSDAWASMNAELDAGVDSESQSALLPEEIGRLMNYAPDSDINTAHNRIADLADAGSQSVSSFPLLRIVADNIVKFLAQDLRHSSSSIIDAALIDIVNVRLGGFMNALPIPSLIAVVTSSALNGEGLIVIDPPLASAYFDALLGGPRARPYQALAVRPFSTVETRLFAHFADIAAKCFANAFESLAKVDVAVDRVETNPRFLVLGKASEKAVRIRLSCQFGE